MRVNPDWEIVAVSALFALTGAYALYAAKRPTDNHYLRLFNQYLGSKGKMMVVVGVILTFLSLIGPQR